MRSLLAGLSSAEIRAAPFPHIVARDVLDPELYAALSANYPSLAQMSWDNPALPMPSNKRFEMSAEAVLNNPSIAACWKEFCGLHSDPAFLSEMAGLFEGHWPEAMLAALGGSLDGQASDRLSRLHQGSRKLRQDARIEINTPVLDRPSSVRRAHLDTPNRLYSCLFYMRAEEDDSEGGDLVLYRWKDGSMAPGARYELPEEAVEKAAIIPYRANQLVVFPQCADAVHGVSSRQPTPHMRRYVFITAELADPWLC